MSMRSRTAVQQGGRFWHRYLLFTRTVLKGVAGATATQCGGMDVAGGELAGASGGRGVLRQ